MYLMTMRFREFTWRDNPLSLRVSHTRNVLETKVPYQEARTEDLGWDRRRVAGEGCFSGPDCMTCWRELQQAFRQPGPGMLQLPGIDPFWAWMDSLELIGAQGKDLVRYAFSFTEWKPETSCSGSGVYSAQTGESLWEYAHRFRVPVERLVQANPHIGDIDQLKAGERVVVP